MTELDLGLSPLTYTIKTVFNDLYLGLAYTMHEGCYLAAGIQKSRCKSAVIKSTQAAVHSSLAYEKHTVDTFDQHRIYNKRMEFFP